MVRRMSSLLLTVLMVAACSACSSGIGFARCGAGARTPDMAVTMLMESVRDGDIHKACVVSDLNESDEDLRRAVTKMRRMLHRLGGFDAVEIDVVPWLQEGAIYHVAVYRKADAGKFNADSVLSSALDFDVTAETASGYRVLLRYADISLTSIEPDPWGA
ncbi:hypothetical protein Uis1B_0846 [Bifidobacterium margollesii]|uniref:Lipoprotein n=1 Tax=Bifidobacterium margollesii TaxID=2020964 RepID=A0A2N5JAU4_9BIFI|nr:hypothetical protein Uis1B_0846 [Bifidobacterium margollesii]